MSSQTHLAELWKRAIHLLKVHFCVLWERRQLLANCVESKRLAGHVAGASATKAGLNTGG